MPKNVAIIGCGPAGLAAAHAAEGLGCIATIFSNRKQPSRLLGPLLLQRPIPGITIDHPDGYVKQIVIGGTIVDYRYKLYGDINISIQGDILAGGYHAWRIHKTYDELWRRYHGQIIELNVTPRSLDEMADSFPLVVNTAPADNFCTDSFHQFTSKEVAVRNVVSVPNQGDNTIIFNADPDVAWVRSSLIFGNPVTEWPIEHIPEDGEFVVIHKPIVTTCNCHPRVLRTGRFGAWHNETWIDTAYYDTRTALVTA